MPTTCNYYVTLRCNQRCEFCNIPHTNDGSPDREPTMDQIEHNLRDLQRLGVVMLDITGGEPTLFKHLIPMLKLAKKLGFFTTVTNNGMLYPKLAKDMVGLVDGLLFSIDSTVPAEHDRIRQMKSFDSGARVARRRAKAQAAPVHLPRRDQRVLPPRRGDDCLRQGAAGDSLSQPLLLLLRQ